MSERPFLVIGEKIHCTRGFKTDGARVRPGPDGAPALTYARGGRPGLLPVPPEIAEGAEWASGRVRHCAVAVRQALHGTGSERERGEDYLQALAEEQTAHGAAFLDVNVDEYSGDTDERVAVIARVAEIVQRASPLPLSIDSSHPPTLRAGLAACDRARGRPMLNSVSLERAGTIELAREFDAAVVASAAGAASLPSTPEERGANLRELVGRLRALGRPDESLYLDPLVFPVATSGENGRRFIESVAALRAEFGPAVHITGGFSNVSFGLPNRGLLNRVFTWLAVEAGADSGIVDPAQINARVLAAADPGSEAFGLARALLMNEDEFGAAYIQACREGRIPAAGGGPTP